MLLAGRVRKPEEEAVILNILGKNFKRTVNPEELFSQKQLTSQFSECRRRSAFTAAPFLFALHQSFVVPSDKKMERTKPEQKTRSEGVWAPHSQTSKPPHPNKRLSIFCPP